MSEKYFSLKTALLFSCSFWLLNLVSAQNLSYQNIESTSFRLYNEHKWDSLITFSQNAIDNHQDYYYLRLRYGIAYYEKQNYPKALVQFQKAANFYSDDPVLLEYMYYSYIFSGRPEDATLLAASFPIELKQKLKIPEIPLLDMINVEIGGTVSDNITMNGDLNMIGNQRIYSETLLFGKNEYYFAGFSLHPKSWIKIYQSLGLISQEVQQKITHRDFSTQITGDTIIHKWFADDMKQTDYYANATISLGKGWTLTPAFHYTSVKLKTHVFDNTDTVHFYATSIDTLQSIKYTYHYPIKSSTITDKIYFLGLSKRIQNVTLGLSGSLSDFSDGGQKILNGFVTWYPKGNLNLYSHTNVAYFKEKRNPSRYVWTQMVGGRIWKKLWLEGTVTFGELTHFVEKSAYVVFNTPDKIKSHFGLTLILPVGDHLELSLFYNNYTKSGTYISFTDVNSFLPKEYSYHNQSIIGGLKWKF